MTTAADMTVNERLEARGLFEDWDHAVRGGDRATMVLLLRRIGIPNAPRVADIVLADPVFYGFAPE